MQAAGWQAEDDVAGFDFGAVDDFLAVHDADAETSHVVFANLVEAWHFSSFTADEGAVGLHTAVSHAFDNLSQLVWRKLADCHVIEEEQWFCTADEDVVDAHGNGVDADGVVLVHVEGQLQLGADAVGAADEHRFFVLGLVEGEQAAEAAEPANHFWTLGLFDIRFNQFNGSIACINIDTGIFIGNHFLFHG